MKKMKRILTAVVAGATLAAGSLGVGLGQLTEQTLSAAAVEVYAEPEGLEATGWYHGLGYAEVDGAITIVKCSRSDEDGNYLYSVEIPAMINGKPVTTIYATAFVNCPEILREVTIPSSVTKIGNGAFAMNIALTDVYYTGTEEEWDAVLIGTSNEPLTDAEIHFNADSTVDSVITSDVLCGDANMDGNVDLKDVILLNKVIAGSVTLSDEALLNADCNVNGYIDSDDSILLLQFLIGLVAKLPYTA